MSDMGFADPAAAQDVRAMLRQAGKELAALKIEALVELVDQRIEAQNNQTAPLSRGGSALTPRNIYRRLCAALQKNLGRNDMAEQQVLHREYVVLELGKIIFGHPQAPQSIEQAKANAISRTAHRLCGDAK